MSDYTKYTKQEMQAYAIAKNIKENQIVIVGTGLPLIGASLAKRAVCPSCHPIVESGLMDCDPVEVPRSVGDNRFMAHCAVQWPNIRFIGFEANEWLHDEDRLVAFIGGVGALAMKNWGLNWFLAIVLMIATLLVIKAITAKKHAGIFAEMAEADKALYSK